MGSEKLPNDIAGGNSGWWLVEQQTESLATRQPVHEVGQLIPAAEVEVADAKCARPGRAGKLAQSIGEVEVDIIVNLRHRDSL